MSGAPIRQRRPSGANCTSTSASTWIGNTLLSRVEPKPSLRWVNRRPGVLSPFQTQLPSALHVVHFTCQLHMAVGSRQRPMLGGIGREFMQGHAKRHREVGREIKCGTGQDNAQRLLVGKRLQLMARQVPQRGRLPIVLRLPVGQFRAISRQGPSFSTASRIATSGVPVRSQARAAAQVVNGPARNPSSCTVLPGGSAR